MEEKLTKQLNIAIGGVFIVAAGILVAMAFTRQSKDNGSQVDSATSTPPVAAATQYDALKGMTEVNLASNFESWTPEGKLDASKTVTKHLAVKGNVTDAYLLVKASEGGNALTKWDSMFFKLNDAGGHLFRPLSLPVPAGDGTTLLYDLNDLAALPNIPYDENRTPDHVKALDVLKDGHTVLVTAFISSLRQSTLGQLSLYYLCASGSDCSVTLR